MRTTSEYVEQLLDELHAARVELQQVRAERASALAKVKAQFAEDAATMRQELTAALAEIDQLRITMFQNGNELKVTDFNDTSILMDLIHPSGEADAPQR